MRKLVLFTTSVVLLGIACGETAAPDTIDSTVEIGQSVQGMVTVPPVLGGCEEPRTSRPLHRLLVSQRRHALS